MGLSCGALWATVRTGNPPAGTETAISSMTKGAVKFHLCTSSGLLNGSRHVEGTLYDVLIPGSGLSRSHKSPLLLSHTSMPLLALQVSLMQYQKVLSPFKGMFSHTLKGDITHFERPYHIKCMEKMTGNAGQNEQIKQSASHQQALHHSLHLLWPCINTTCPLPAPPSLPPTVHLMSTGDFLSKEFLWTVKTCIRHTNEQDGCVCTRFVFTETVQVRIPNFSQSQTVSANNWEERNDGGLLRPSPLLPYHTTRESGPYIPVRD